MRGSWTGKRTMDNGRCMINVCVVPRRQWKDGKTSWEGCILGGQTLYLSLQSANVVLALAFWYLRNCTYITYNKASPKTGGFWKYGAFRNRISTLPPLLFLISMPSLRAEPINQEPSPHNFLALLTHRICTHRIFNSLPPRTCHLISHITWRYHIRNSPPRERNTT